MKALDVDLRYYHKPQRTGISEADIVRRNFRVSLPLERVALILVDVWNEVYVATFNVRAEKIVTQAIAPLARAFRRSGALVVHAPSPRVADKYPKFVSALPDEEAGGAGQADADWPPSAFRNRTGPYAAWAVPQEPDPATPEFEALIEHWRITKEVEPVPGDLVIRTGVQLHRELCARKVLWLVYAGFAANVCMQRRDYGMREMEKRGYGIILVRDGTTAIETAQSRETLALTEAAIGGDFFHG